MRPPRRRVPHRAARAATSWSPRPPSASRPARRSLGISGPARSVTSTRTMPSPALTATVTVSPGAHETECRTELPKTSLTSRIASSLHGCSEPSTSETNARAARARSARPASVTVSRTARPAITAPAFPAALARESRAGGRTHRDGRSTRGQTSRSGSPRNGHRNLRQAATDTAPWPRFPSAMRPWTPQHNALQRYKVTHGRTKKNAPLARDIAASGTFSQRVAGVGFEPT